MDSTVYSDEQLEAFIDDEISTGDRARLLEALEHDNELAYRVCEMMHVKDAVKLAYRESQPATHVEPGWIKSRVLVYAAGAFAATLLFSLGTLTGLVIHNLDGATRTASTIQGLPSIQLASAAQEKKRVVLHISTANRDRLEQALDDAELLLSSYNGDPDRVQLEVVANTEGLALLRADISPYAERIRDMAREHRNVSFLACSRTIEKLILNGVSVHLLPEAKVIPGALEEIVDRLQEGWVYIRV